MESRSRNSVRDSAICVVLAVATVAVYWQITGHEFINYDDKVYVTENPWVRGGLTAYGLTWAFSDFYANNWHPLTWLSHMADCSVYGLDPFGHHLTNLLLHVANALLLFVLLRNATNSVCRSAFVAGLFALHPLHVESVAWVAERKDVLSTTFWMLTILAYIRYVRSRTRVSYVLVVCSLAIGLLAKPMLVTLPLVLLLLDHWPLRRLGPAVGAGKTASGIRQLVFEKLPLFALSAGSCIVTYLAQREGGAVGTLAGFPMGVRIANAVVSYVSYLGKAIWPSGLAVFYPHPGNTLPEWQIVGAAALLAFVTVLVTLGRRAHPYLATGWLWYLGTLLPVIGLVQIGWQGMADRYTYVPLVGAYIMVAWGVPELLRRSQVPAWVTPVLWAAALVSLGVATPVQVHHWRNSVSLFEHALACTRGNYAAHNNLGTALAEKGLLDEAMAHFAEAVAIEPRSAEGHSNMGVALRKLRRLEEAEAELRTAVEIEHDNALYRYRLAAALVALGRRAGAIEQCRQALRIRPGYAEVRCNMGVLLQRQGKRREAIREYRKAIESSPGFGPAYHNLAAALYEEGEYAAAWQNILMCRRHALEPNQEFLRMLRRKMPEPAGGLR